MAVVVLIIRNEKDSRRKKLANTKIFITRKEKDSIRKKLGNTEIPSHTRNKMKK